MFLLDFSDILIYYYLSNPLLKDSIEMFKSLISKITAVKASVADKINSAKITVASVKSKAVAIITIIKQ